MGYALDLLSEVFQAQGMAADKARRTAEIALAVQVAAGLVTSDAIDLVDRDAHVYKLRGMRITMVAIGERVHLARANVFLAVRRHHMRRRAVLQLIA